ncbi:MAG TPA: MHYT domain-containing protein [Longimicrobium sp.]|nr:MHYT domain-containing protein [Longimicrobium sp.]
MKGSHNATLVAFSILIAILASYSALALSARVNAARGRFRVAWLAGGSVALGIGVWSMHFVGLLAYRLPVPISYAVPLWLLSLTIAMGASLLALWVTSRPAVPISARIAAGILLGLAVAGMHYAGMGAMRIPGRIDYDPAIVVLSVAVAVAAGCGIIWLFMRLRGEDSARGQRERIAAAVAMGGALAAIHYAGMAAARFTPVAEAVRVHDDSVLRTGGLAAVVIAGTLGVLAVTLLTTRVDRRLRARDEETEAVRRSEARFRSLVVASAQVVWTAGADGTFVEPQASWGAYTGTSWEEYGSGGWIASVHPDDRARVAAEWRDAVADRRVMDVEFRLRRADGDWRHVAVRAVPVTEPGGRVREWVGAVTDVTERRQAEAARDFLAEASRVLSSSLDTEITLRTVARLAVPTLADWCAVDVLTEDGEVQRLAVEHVDPEKVRLALEIEERWPSDRTAPQGVHHVMRTGEAEMMEDIPESLLTAGARDPEHLRMIRALGLRSYVCVPLMVRRRVLGALTLVHAESGRSYTPADLALAEELAGRAAVAIDNARLYTETEESRIQLEQQTAELEEAQAEMEMAHDELQRANEDLEERTRESERAREAADEANAAKSAFLATMSHELRTPLNAIAGYTQLIDMGIHGPVSEAQREALDKIHRNQTHLLGLINDVLNFAKIEAGQVQYDVDDVPLNATLSAVEALVEPQLRAKGLRYRYGGGDPSLTVRADRERMEQVVLNLLSNAVKFTDRGGQVELSWEVQGGAVRINVCDTGRGIPPDKLEAIFEPFIQVDPALTRSAEGTGLGLAISRDLARAMKGDLTARSAEGQGSVFTLTLPQGRPVHAAVENAAD